MRDRHMEAGEQETLGLARCAPGQLHWPALHQRGAKPCRLALGIGLRAFIPLSHGSLRDGGFAIAVFEPGVVQLFRYRFPGILAISSLLDEHVRCE